MVFSFFRCSCIMCFFQFLYYKLFPLFFLLIRFVLFSFTVYIRLLNALKIKAQMRSNVLSCKIYCNNLFMLVLLYPIFEFDDFGLSSLYFSAISSRRPINFICSLSGSILKYSRSSCSFKDNLGSFLTPVRI